MSEPIFQFEDEHNNKVSFFKDGDDLSAQLIGGDLKRHDYVMDVSDMLDKISQVTNNSDYRVTIPISDEVKGELEDLEDQKAHEVDFTPRDM